MAPRRVLVTGGAGFIGSHLVDALAARGDHVTVVDNLSVGVRDNLAHHDPAQVELHVADVLDAPRMNALVEGVDIVFHLATQCVRLSLFEPELVHRVNTEGTLRMLMAAAAAGVGRFVYVSSSEAFGSAQTVPMAEDHPFDPTTIYGASKLAGEHYTTAFHRTHGLEHVIVRPFNTYGPREHFEGAYGEVIPKFVVRAMNGKRPIIFGDGKQTRDFTFVEDTVRGMLLAAESTGLNGRSVNVARGVEVTITEIARLVLEACGRTDLRAGVRPGAAGGRAPAFRRHHARTARARLRSTGRHRRGDPPVRGLVPRDVPRSAELLPQEQAYNWQPIA